MKEYIDKAEVYSKVSTIVGHLIYFYGNTKLEEKDSIELNNILTELTELKFWIFDTPSAKVIETPYKLRQKYYVKAITCSCGGYENKGEFFPGSFDCEGCCEECDKEFTVRERSFRSIDEMFWMKDFEGKTFWLHPEDVPI